jgi:hypothetical protein
MTTAGKRIIVSAQEALDFVQGQYEAGTKVHIPHEIDVRRTHTRKKVICDNLSNLADPATAATV